MASDRGHEVMYSPPHYSDLQPIEIVWAIGKGEVGRQFDANTKLKDVLIRIKAAFSKMKTKTVRGCIAKANEKLVMLRDQIAAIEEAERADENSSDTLDDEYHSADDHLSNNSDTD